MLNKIRHFLRLKIAPIKVLPKVGLLENTIVSD